MLKFKLNKAQLGVYFKYNFTTAQSEKDNDRLLTINGSTYRISNTMNHPIHIIKD